MHKQEGRVNITNTDALPSPQADEAGSYLALGRATKKCTLRHKLEPGKFMIMTTVFVDTRQSMAVRDMKTHRRTG